jgi:hypothetical protein
VVVVVEIRYVYLRLRTSDSGRREYTARSFPAGWRSR